MSDVHEQMEYAEHAKHAAHASKQIALLIAFLALFLALSEMLGKSANTEALTLNISVSDTWNQYQAKTIRKTIVEVAAGDLKAGPDSEAVKTQIAWLESEAKRYDLDPKSPKDGRQELRKRAEELEHERDAALASYHNYEVASAAFQIGIVLCSAAVVTGMLMLAWIAGGVGALGVLFVAVAYFFPHLLGA
jgi:hypothetical protein